MSGDAPDTIGPAATPDGPEPGAESAARQELVRERHGPVLVARLNRPAARNALTPGLLKAVGATMVEAEADPDVRVVVLTGTGDRAFCAGLDLRSFGGGESIGTDRDEATQGFFRLMDGDIRVPLVGAANGAAIGGGLELLLGCDLVVASSEAKFGLPEVKRGLFPGGNGTTIGRRVPLSVALEMLLTGDPVTATRAHEVGLVNTVVPPDDVLSTALALAERIAANAPLGLAAAKELVRLAVTDAAKAAVRLKEHQATVFSSEDAKEGAMAFVEKRAPVWKGR